MSISDYLKRLFVKGDELDRKTHEALESDDQREMIRGVIEFGETTVKEVMVPRVDTDLLSADMPKDEFLTRVAKSEHSRFPVYRETIDNIIGVVYVKDILKKLIENSEFEITDILRKPFFVPETKHIDDLLHEFQRRRVHIAVVVDEYGGVSGIVCMEDIIEEIIGDIQDEFDNEREEIIKLSDVSWLCDARYNLSDLSEKIEASLPVDEFDTLGGFVFDLFGKIPVRYEKVSYNNISFIIQEIEGRKINTIKIVINETA
ncbi:MAG: hemolysin family protein [Termitinemataceae bacterium]|nr:MAG: hemolysin family protein [Termitinemataceae bacterium]